MILILKRLLLNNNNNLYRSQFLTLKTISSKTPGKGLHFLKLNLKIFILIFSDQPKSVNLIENFYNERIFQEITIDNFQPLYDNNVDNRSKIHEILQLYELNKYTTQEVPTKLTLSDMEKLLSTFNDKNELEKMLKFFYTRECDRFKSKRKSFFKKQENRQKKLEKYGNDDNWNSGIFDNNGELIYGLWHNSLLSRISKQCARDYRHKNLLRQSALFGQKLIIDLDYDQYMKPSEIGLLAQQIAFLFYENRLNRNFNILPFDIHFTNCNRAERSMSALNSHIRRMDNLIHYFHNESYLKLPDLFPREHLVYLSPHASKSLKKYDHDDIYILGGYNDRSSHVQASHIKAETEGIRCYRLPLDENVLWKQGNKNLCLNQVVAILHCVKATNDWRMAIMNYAPQRKIRSLEEIELENQIRLKHISKRIKNIENSYRLN